MRRKNLASVCCLAMTIGMLTGCSGSSSSTDTSSSADNGAGATAEQADTSADSGSEDTSDAGTTADDPSAVEGTLVYWTYTDNAYDLVEAFNAVYPNVTIDVQVFGGDEYRTKILTALQSGTDMPDVFDLEENYVYEFLDSDLIADLSYINIEDLTSNYYDYQKVSMLDSNGNYKCLTYESNPVCFWYLRDACEEWLGTSDPDEISAMITSWDDLFELQEKVYKESDGTVYVFGNIAEMVKVVAFSFDPLVQDGKLVISDDWIGLLDDMRTFYNSGYDPEYGSWGSDWAAAWNDGTLLFRAMPSWDYFTDWDMNDGNVGICAPFEASFEGMTGICVYNESENKELAGTFLTYLASDEFQIVNMNEHNQVPASKTAVASLAEGYSAESFGGQNLFDVYADILENVEAITPDKYTRAVQNLFQNAAANGIRSGDDNDAIIESFKTSLADSYPEIVIE